MKLEQYRTIVFDCDGVILNSNKVKTQAFYNAVLPYGEIFARRFVDYHIANGGISRYKKFEYFLKHILGESDLEYTTSNSLLETYADEVWKGLLRCEVAEGLEKLREKTSTSCWMVVSGGDQAELRELFEKRNLIRFFDGGIFGSPDSKDCILDRELKHSNIKHPAIFWGDSKYDYIAASNAKLDFAFISDWTEFKDWKEYFNSLNVPIFSSIRSILSGDNGEA